MRRKDLRSIGIILVVMAFVCIGGGVTVSYLDESVDFQAPSMILGQENGGITISTIDDEGPDGLTASADDNDDGKNDDSPTDKSDEDKSGNTGSTGDNNTETPPSGGSNSGSSTGGSSSSGGSSSTGGSSPSGGSSTGGASPSGGGSSTGGASPSGGNSSGNTGGTSSGSGSTGGDNTGESNSPPTPSITETNNALRNSIQSTYNISIKYGSETSGYSVGGMSTEVITDENVIQTALYDLQATIALFPTGMWSEMKNSGFPLTIYLITRYSTANVTGVTETFSNRVNISVAINFPFGESFNHEVFHYFENYMTKFKGGNFNNWSSLNPSGFTYGSINSGLSYSKTYSADSYFVNDYAQTQAGEDRASTFEYMMYTNKASCLNNGKPVWQKAKYMADQLDYYFNSVSPYVTEYWERHL